MKIPCDTRTLTWTHKNGGGSFRPATGTLRQHGDRALLSNPRRWEAEGETLSARVIVGFLPKDEPGTKLTRSQVEGLADLVVDIVRVTRTKQVGDPGATFLTQRGLYKHAESGEVVDEPGMQVVLINTTGAARKKFERDVEDLAEELARELDQEEVIVEIQKNGVTQTVFGVGT